MSEKISRIRDHPLDDRCLPLGIFLHVSGYVTSALLCGPSIALRVRSTVAGPVEEQRTKLIPLTSFRLQHPTLVSAARLGRDGVYLACFVTTEPGVMCVAWKVLRAVGAFNYYACYRVAERRTLS